MSYVYGLDISKHNGTLDFNAIENAGNDFVIIRAGYGVSATKDPKFEEYYKKAKEVGLKVGAYWYSYALNVDDAKKEAQNFINAIKGKQFEYPVYIDMEDADGYKRKKGMPSNTILSDICEVFCKTVEDAGYYVGVYASESWFNNQLKSMSKAYDRWVANWGTNDGTLQNKKTSYRMHQFTSEYKLNSKRFDRNVVYEYDYPSVIKNAGLNGFTKGSSSSSSTKPSTETKPTTSLKHKQGETVKLKGLYTSSDGSGYTTKIAISSGKITKVLAGKEAPYLINDGAGWANDSCIK